MFLDSILLFLLFHCFSLTSSLGQKVTLSISEVFLQELIGLYSKIGRKQVLKMSFLLYRALVLSHIEFLAISSEHIRPSPRAMKYKH